MVTGYFPALRKTTVDGNPALNTVTPRYKRQDFANETEFYNYITAEDYNTNSST